MRSRTEEGRTASRVQAVLKKYNKNEKLDCHTWQNGSRWVMKFKNNCKANNKRSIESIKR